MSKDTIEQQQTVIVSIVRIELSRHSEFSHGLIQTLWLVMQFRSSGVECEGMNRPLISLNPIEVAPCIDRGHLLWSIHKQWRHYEINLDFNDKYGVA
jgi:hypothetical protein